MKNMKEGRNTKGQFLKGNKLSVGRTRGSAKKYVKEMCWDSIHKVCKLLFYATEKEMNAWLKKNKVSLTKAERVFLDNADDLKTIEALLDRMVGKAKQAMDLTSDGEKIDSVAPAITVYIPKNGREKED